MPIVRVGDGLVRPMFRPLAISASGLSAQRARLETIAQNIANAEVTRTPEDGPYRRRIVMLEARGFSAVQAIAEGELGAEAVTQITQFEGVEVMGVEEDLTEGPLVYDPGHPDADEAGYVRYPNVDMTTEMVDLMEARRMYEANATVFQAAKAMIRQALDI